MPSLEYSKSVLRYWNDVLKPKYMLIRNFFADKEWERSSESYRKGHNFLRGNLLSLSSFESILDQYEILDQYGLQHSFTNNCPKNFSYCFVMERK